MEVRSFVNQAVGFYDGCFYMGSFAGLGRGIVLRNLHDGCTEWVWSLNGGSKL